MTQASPEHQAQLLRVQQIDTQLAQAAHRRSATPRAAAVTALQYKVQGVRDRMVAAEVRLADAAHQAAKAEEDANAVAARKVREEERLASESLSPRALQALEGDIAHLNRRLDDLESVQLQAMAAVEDAEAAKGSVAAELATLDAELVAAQAELAAEYEEIDAHVASLTADRERAAEGLPADLAALYDKIRARQGGIGAAPLVGRRCEGCRIDLTEGDLQKVREAAPTQVLRCEECSRILVRTEQTAR